MAPYNYNFDDVQESTRGAVPADRYRLKVDSVTPKDGKQQGVKMARIMFRVIGGTYKGSNVFTNLVIAHSDPDKLANCLSMVKSFMSAAGFNVKGNVTVDPRKWMNKIVDAKVRLTKSEQYGEQNEIDRFFAPEEATDADGDEPWDESPTAEATAEAPADLPPAEEDSPDEDDPFA